MYCVIDKETKKVIRIGEPDPKYPNSDYVVSVSFLQIPNYNNDNAILEKWNNDDKKTRLLAQEGKEFYAIYNENNELIGFDVQDLPVDMDKLREEKIQEISNECEKAIFSGFKSLAYQGIEKNYDSTSIDQDNIIGNAVAATNKLLGIETCKDDKFYYKAIGEDQYNEWQPLECLQLAKDFKTFKETQLFKNKQIASYINNPKRTAEEINAVTWDMVIPQEGE